MYPLTEAMEKRGQEPRPLEELGQDLNLDCAPYFVDDGSEEGHYVIQHIDQGIFYKRTGRHCKQCD